MTPERLAEIGSGHYAESAVETVRELYHEVRRLTAELEQTQAICRGAVQILSGDFTVDEPQPEGT